MSKPAAMQLLGAGGHAKVVAEIIRESGIEFLGALGREDCTREVDGITIPHSVDVPLCIAIGDNRKRALIAANLEADYPPLISSHAYVSPSASIGEGTVVMPGAAVMADANVGRFVILNTRCSIDHDCRIGDFAHISPGATLCGGVSVGEGAWICAGATVAPGVTIGDRAVVGAGSTILADVPAGVKALGLWKR